MLPVQKDDKFSEMQYLKKIWNEKKWNPFLMHISSRASTCD